MLKTVPIGLFSPNYRVIGGDQTAELRFDIFAETGSIIIGDTTYEIERENPFVGFWSLELDGEPVMTSKKPSALHRAFEIYTPSHLLSLEPKSSFGLDMKLTGDGYDAGFEPESFLSRRTVLEGEWQDFLTICFAFWLVILMRRRSYK